MKKENKSAKEKPLKKETVKEPEKDKSSPGNPAAEKPAHAEPARSQPLAQRPPEPKAGQPAPVQARQTIPGGERPAQEAAPGKEGGPEKPKSKPAWDTRTLLFNRWETSDVVVNDQGLRKYINLDPVVVPRTGGKYGSARSQKDMMPIAERFMNRLMVSGHRGKKHKLTSGRHAGKTLKLYNTLKEAFITIEKKTNKNPIQVLVTAIENSALLEEVASYRLGGIIARNAVITSPQRRLDLALRYLTQGIYKTSFRSRKSLSGVIADELIAASNNDSKSFAVSERNRIEREAEGAR
jgi:small subunit ribosomal protein S7